MATACKYDTYNFPHTNPDAPPGHPGNLSEIQEAQVHQLRSMLEAEGHTKRLDTNSMLRYLRARKFDVAAAKLMYTNAEKWRKETKLDDIVESWDYPEKPQVFEYYPQYYHKTDKDGRPVYIEKLGKIDLTQLMKITEEQRMLTNLAVENLLQYVGVPNLQLPGCFKANGERAAIMDLKGVGITSVPSAYGYLKKASVISQDYYPERLGKLYIINAPWGFSSVWSIVKGWLDKVTQEKIAVLGGSYSAELLKQIPAENLPVEFGGTCSCEGGCPLSDHGPWKEAEWAGPGFRPVEEEKVNEVAAEAPPVAAAPATAQESTA
ncbi:Patellin-3 [Drechslerella dactyloides]|uniref:Patellin-3 n=1 Tax=Drechslerella dactyloides TaxID=74499 RepID=A0AAD6J1N6_DREDA|nr:Patellin-3 [Drechslerella dactyloides]